MGIVLGPVPLDPGHVLDGFDCGEPVLNDWLVKRARRNQLLASSTFVVCGMERVVGFYCLATGSVGQQGAPRMLRQNMPDPVPVVVLGRLAVDAQYRGQNIGAGLLQDALLRANNVQKNAGCRALLVHALNEDAKAFYVKFGFRPFAGQPLTLFMPLPVTA